LLQGLLLALGGEQVGLLGRLGRWAKSVAAALAPSPAESAPAVLSPSDVRDLVAFAEVLVGGDALPTVERAYLVDHVQQQQRAADGEYYVALYLTTVRVLTRLSGARFATLDLAVRRALMARHRIGVSNVRPDESPGTLRGDVRTVRTRAVPDLISGYYASPAGWAVVGYSIFPGRCGDLMRYTRAEP
jgi:hypothetical protein